MASDKLLRFAAGVNAGKGVVEAALDAGYAESTAKKQTAQLLERARAEGLVLTEAEVVDVLDMFRQTILGEDGGAGLRRAWQVQLARAQSGDNGAMRLIMEYLAGKPGQQLLVEGDHTVELIVRDDAADAE